MDKLATCLHYIKVFFFKTSTIFPFSLAPKGMAIYKHVGIIWGILVSSFIWANDLEEHDWTGAVVKQEKQSACCLWIPSVTTELCCYDVTPCLFCDGNATHHLCMPRRLFLFFMLSTRSWKRNQPVFLACQNYESVPLLSGLGIILPPFMVIFICNMEVLRKKRRVISWWSLLQPSPGFWSLLFCGLLAQSQTSVKWWAVLQLLHWETFWLDKNGS